MPGSCSTGSARNAPQPAPPRRRARSAVVGVPGGHREQVPDPHRGQVVAPTAGASSGKVERPGGRRDSLPSATARPTAVEVKLLDSEKSSCSRSARTATPALGDHLAVPHHHQGVQLQAGRIQPLDQVQQGGRS